MIWWIIAAATGWAIGRAGRWLLEGPWHPRHSHQRLGRLGHSTPQQIADHCAAFDGPEVEWAANSHRPPMGSDDRGPVLHGVEYTSNID